MSLVYIILGGNRGNRQEIFCRAIILAGKQIGTVGQTSSLYESESWGFQSDHFYNQVISIHTKLTPNEVLNQCLSIENQLGRVRNKTGYEDRTIDIDLLYFDDAIIESKELTVPHPRIYIRKFVLIPLAEIAPTFVDPVKKMTTRELLDRCDDTSRVWKVMNA